MATRHVNQPFDEETRRQAFRLIEEGKIFKGGFWKNRDLTSRRCGYGGWQEVPENVKRCVNQIGRAASRRGRERAKKAKEVEARHFCFSPLTKEVLNNIWEGVIQVPRNTHPDQIKIIREYVTRIESRMAKAAA
jgi:hypothetical protein